MNISKTLLLNKIKELTNYWWMFFNLNKHLNEFDWFLMKKNKIIELKLLKKINENIDFNKQFECEVVISFIY